MKKVLYFGIVLISILLGSHSINAVATISGTVTDSTTGRAIAGALVQAIKGNQVRYSTTTANDGTYTLAGIQPSNYTLTTSASGYQMQSIGVNPKNNQTTIVNSALIPNGGTITGTVTNATTSLPVPIAGATVAIFQGPTFIISTTTDGTGFYSVPNLAPGSYT